MFGKSWRGVFPNIAYTGCSTEQGMVFDLSFDWVYSLTPVCPKQGISCEFVLFVNRVLPAVLNRVRVLNPHCLTYTQILVEYLPPPPPSFFHEVFSSSTPTFPST